jgi:hypothetical protein
VGCAPAGGNVHAAAQPLVSEGTTWDVLHEAAR